LNEDDFLQVITFNEEANSYKNLTELLKPVGQNKSGIMSFLLKNAPTSED
jgi:hypothetical protein